MALDFLQLIPTVAAAYGAYKASQPTKAEGMQAQQLANQQYYQEQLADPNSQLMTAYANSERDRLDRTYAGSINDLITQNRRQTNMGRTPLFDAERGDQQIYRAQQLGYQQNADKSKELARQTISGLATGAGTSATGYGNAVANQQKRQTQEAYLPVNMANAGVSIYDAIRKQGGIQSPRLAGASTSMPSSSGMQADYNMNPQASYA